MSTRLDVQAPRIDYVHPTWFEAGKPVDLILYGSSLDQPNFRSLLSFDGDYLKHDCYRLTSHDTFDHVKNGDLIPDSQHEIFRIKITQSRPDIHGPAFVEVENIFGLSNFVPILFGSKQLCSELERIQDALCGSYSKNNVLGELLSASSDPHERRKLHSSVMSGFLIDIGWLIRNPTPDEFKNVLSSTNIQRWICILKFLIQNDFINVLEIIVKSMDSIMGSEVLSNLERGRLEDHVTAFLGYVSHARNIVDRRANHDEKTQMDTGGISVNSPNQPILGASLPLASENTDIGGDNKLNSADEEETMPLVTRDVSRRQCCQPDMTAGWLKPSLIVSYPGGATRMRLVTTVVVAAVLCFTACLVLFHPHGVGVLVAPVKRYCRVTPHHS